jgi:hypothetical protein
MPYMDSSRFSVADDDQAAYDVADGAPSWQVLNTTLPDVQFASNDDELALGVAHDTEEDALIPGSRHGGTLSFRARLDSQLTTYDPTSDTPALSPLGALLAECVGASAAGATGLNAHAAAAGDGDTWILASGAMKVGQAYACGEEATNPTFAISSLGWVKSLAASTHEMFEDTIANLGIGDDIYPMVTAYTEADPSTPTPRTFRVVGANAAHAYLLIGCVPTRCVLDLASGKPPMVELTFVFTDYEFDTSGGGLLTPTTYQYPPPAMGVNKGRVFLNGTSTGTADADGSSGIGSLRVEIGLEYSPIESHAGQQGVADMICTGRRVRVSGTVPFTTDYIESSDIKWANDLVNGDVSSLSYQTGGHAGKLFAMLLPAGVPKKRPSFQQIEKMLAFDFEFAPAEYSGDTDPGSDDASNTRFRLAWG